MSPDFIITIPAGPVFDSRLRIALESIRVQSVSVHVALCDASADQRCKDLADDYADIIKYRRHGADFGQSAAINEGWNELSGKFYGWLNVDDYLAPDALDRALNNFQKNADAQVVYGTSLMKREMDFIGMHHEAKPPSDRLYFSNIISQPSCFVRRDALFACGLLKENLHYTMDWDLWVRLMHDEANFVFDEKILSVVTLGKGTKTAEFNYTRAKEIFHLVYQYSSVLRALKTSYAMWLHNLYEYSWFKRPLSSTNTGKIFLRHDNFGASQRSVEISLFHYELVKTREIALNFSTKRRRHVYHLNQKIATFDNDHFLLPLRLDAGEKKEIVIESDGSDEDMISSYYIC